MYYFIYTLTWLVTLLPIRLLYLISDFIYLLVYHVVKYRRKVVRKNLNNSFPEKSLSEIIKIEKKFYRHFCDIFIEMTYQFHLSQKSMLKRMVYKNPELILEQYQNNKSVMLMSAHYCNWEWSPALAMHLPKDKNFYAIYKQLTNKHFDRLIAGIRTQYGGKVIEAKSLYPTMLKMKNNGILGTFLMAADQRPAPKSARHWVRFLNQDTAVMTGTEQLARKFNYPVILMHVERIKRGYFSCEFEMIEAEPKNTQDFIITERYMELLEEKIRKNPEYWLWTHNRWKHKRPTE